MVSCELGERAKVKLSETQVSAHLHRCEKNIFYDSVHEKIVSKVFIVNHLMSLYVISYVNVKLLRNNE